ncbi:MAG: nitronate monooxygenase [Burkholderiaceae bacterium]|jgi:nitronate monooxygenase|nr:nitronate monooxygenase [Burkholderiaceae bacterium]
MSDDLSFRLPLTPLCKLLGMRYPLILAGMGGVARAELVAAVSQAGGFGFLGMVREPLALIREEIERVRARTELPFGVNLIPAATPPALLAQQVDLCIALRVPVIGLFWDLAGAVVDKLRAAGIMVVCQVGSAADAIAAQEAGACALIVQGIEAGGHVRGRQPLAELLAQVLSVTDLPVAAAGGLATGADLVRVLDQGAQAAVFGTALIATQESFAHDYHKQRLIQAKDGDTELTEAFHINWPPHAPVRVLKNSVTRGERGDPFHDGSVVIGNEQGHPIYLFSTDSPLRSMTGDYEAMALYAGQGVGKIDAIKPATQRVADILEEAAALRRSMGEPRIELASPVCYAGEFIEDAQIREIHKDVITVLDELLEAERAGARVTLRSASQTQDEALRQVIQAVHRDEVKWCAMLMRNLRKLRATPGTRTGAFYDKAMAIDGLRDRLVFLNRGQGWVVRKLDALIPVVDDPEISQDLTQMLEAHRSNIGLVNTALDDRHEAS